VGTLSTQDPDSNSFTYSLLDNAGGRFSIDAATGQVHVANGLLLDFEQNATHNITVRSTDSNNQSLDKILAVTINDVNPENVVDDGSSHTFVGGAGDDTFIGNGGDDTFDGRGGVNVLRGNDGNDHLIGGVADNIGIDVLDGGPGNDTMAGGPGDDTYVVDSGNGSGPGDQVIEGASAGTDTIEQDVPLYYMPTNVENLVLNISAVTGVDNELDNTIIGNDLNNELGGGDGNDVLRGNAGNDLLFGGDGIDVLDGGSGADAMLGGSGDDTYAVDEGNGIGSGGDQVIENANEGTDLVEQDVPIYFMPDNVENLVMNRGAVVATGNGLQNTIGGNALDNQIDGGGGADTLTGGLGNDLFVFHAGEANGDTVVDFQGNGAAAGDLLEFHGYGPGATFTQNDATHWQVNYNGGTQHDVITFSNAAAVHPSDFVFV
jgi:Ca2+-binding RTX toxin-like protein